MQEKFEVLVAFKSYKALVNKEVENLIKIFVQTVEENTTHMNLQIFESHGTKRQLTTTYMPQQNGVCEKKLSYYFE